MSTDTSTEALKKLITRTMIDGPVVDMFTLPTDVDYKDTDFYVDTFPKCGTNYMQQITHLVRMRGDDSVDSGMAIPWIMKANLMPGGSKGSIERASQFTPRIFATHSEAKDALKLPGKHIVVVRKPEDACISFYHFMPNNANISTDDLSLEDFYFGYYSNHIQQQMNYWAFVAGWYQERENPRVMFIFYEDLKKNFDKNLARIEKFLDIELKPEERAQVTEKSSFAYMSAHKSDNPAMVSRVRKHFNTPDDEPQLPFTGRVRQGGSNYEIPAKIKAHMDLMWAMYVRPVTGCDSYEQLLDKMTKQ